MASLNDKWLVSLWLPPITPVLTWPSPHPRTDDDCGGGGGMGGGKGIAVSLTDVFVRSKEETEGKVDVDELGCTVVDSELNVVVRLSAVDVPVAFWAW